MTPPPFGTFPKKHPFWYFHSSLSATLSHSAFILVGSPAPPPETQTQTGDATPEPAPVTTYYISPTPPLTPHLTSDQFGRSVHSELSQWFSFAIAILALTGCLMTIALMANKPVKGF